MEQYLGQAAGYCSHYFGSGCWLLITLSWTWLLVIVPIILDQAVGYCSNDFGSGKKNGNSNEQPGPK
jgi:hypothetical protein